ncbi:MAG TPA: ROK family protein, partial [Solirubrobacteraceae bacterium]|nr:ROK family protein [Solirubrobacteraceae bacterium]
MAVYGGIDLGGTKIQTVLMRSDDQEVLGQARSLTPHEGGPSAVVDALEACLEQAAEAAGIVVADLDGVGVGVPGEVNARAGTLAKATNLSEWEQPYPLAAKLSERLGPGVRLGNDVSVATQAELLLGAGRDTDSLLAVFWGTGVGGGVAFDGKLWHGRGDAGEIGHMVVKQGGARCPCGRKGCMEAYAGRRAMEREAKRLHEGGHHTDLFKI